MSHLPALRRLLVHFLKPRFLSWPRKDSTRPSRSSWRASFLFATSVKSHLQPGGRLSMQRVLCPVRGGEPHSPNLWLGIACGQPRIGVDIHVHRVTNRWGYVRARTPEQTMAEIGRASWWGRGEIS